MRGAVRDRRPLRDGVLDSERMFAARFAVSAAAAVGAVGGAGWTGSLYGCPVALFKMTAPWRLNARLG